MITAAIAIVLAQTCAGMLPPRDMDVEWQRNGSTYARDVLIESTASSRTYRRSLPDGRRSTRTLICATVNGRALLAERVGSERQVRIPVALGRGGSVVVEGVTIRRIDAPDNGAPDARWFSVAGPLPRVYGVRTGAGIVEMRMQSPSGTVDVYRAFLRRPPPPPPPPPQAPMEIPTTALEAQIGVLQDMAARLTTEKRALEDSLLHATSELQRLREDSVASSLRMHSLADSVGIPRSPLDERLLTMLAVDVYAEREEYDRALALLAQIQTQLAAFEATTAHVHPAAQRVAEKVKQVTKACDRADRLDRNGRCAPLPASMTYRVTDIIGLLQGGVHPDVILAGALEACPARDGGRSPWAAVFLRLGATPEFAAALPSSCVAG